MFRIKNNSVYNTVKIFTGINQLIGALYLCSL